MKRWAPWRRAASIWAIVTAGSLAPAGPDAAQEKPVADKSPAAQAPAAPTPPAAPAAPDAPAAPPAASDAGDPNARAAEQLKKPTKVHFEAKPLNDVIVSLSETAGVDVVVIWRTTTEVNPQTPVTLTLRNPRPVEDVLRLVLRVVGGGLEANLENGILIVAAPAADAPAGPPEVKTEVYDLTDLIQKGDGAAPPDEQKAQLVKLVTQMVAPESWRDAGGGVGSVAVIGRKMVVRHTEEAHTEIAKLLLTIK